MSTSDGIAILALLIAALAYWKSFGVWVSIVEVKGGDMASTKENNWKMFQYYSVTLKNRGIPLHDISVCLRYSDGSGQETSVEMRPVEYGEEHNHLQVPDVFSQSNVVTFSLRSHDSYVPRGCRELDCPRKRNARLVVKSQKYLIAEIPLWCRFYWARSFWNRWAHRFNSLFDREYNGAAGSGMIKKADILPRFNTDKHSCLMSFTRGLLASQKNPDQ